MKVLVPYDGAELSEQAAVMAIELLAQHPLDLLLLRVGPTQPRVRGGRIPRERGHTPRRFASQGDAGARRWHP